MTNVYSLTRVEPVSRGGDPGDGLAATIHDPLWTLARQRQFGELTGEDAGTPVQATFTQAERMFDGWQPEGGAVLPYSPAGDVVEALVAGEAAGPSHSVEDSIDAGRVLAASVTPAVNALLMTRFPIASADPSNRIAARAALVFADGLAVATEFSAAGADDAAVGSALGIPTADIAAIRGELDTFSRWCSVTFGTGPNSWIPERLERRFGLATGGAEVLRAPAHSGERVDWSDFDFVTTPALKSGAQSDAHVVAPSATQPVSRSRIPLVIQFPGMPADRFWQFEDAKLALARIDASTTDLGRLALVEFSTVYGNDWFQFPIPASFGSTQTVGNLVIRDTFGTHEFIAPAAEADWAIYRPTGAPIVSPTLYFPAVTVSPLIGPTTEEVAFARDEMADFVWALERLVTDAEGERHDLPAEYARDAPAPAAIPTDADLLYRLMTEVPPHWIPFIPVQAGADLRQVGLVEAVLPRPDSFGDMVISAPRSSIVQELQGVVLPEEEVPAAGVVVRRRWFLARSADGGRYAWASRSVISGRGEASSGLKFDFADHVGTGPVG
jgi:hypothetical protein